VSQLVRINQPHTAYLQHWTNYRGFLRIF